MQYRDQEAQTSRPVLQDQTVAVVDIPPPMLDPAPTPEPTVPHTDAPSLTGEAMETDEPHTANPTHGVGNPSGFDPRPRPGVIYWIGQQPRSGDGPNTVPPKMSPLGHSPCPQTHRVLMLSQRLSPQTNVLTLTLSYLKYLREVDHSPLYPTEGPDRASSQRDTPRSEDYKSCQSPRHKMDHLSGCFRI